MKRRLDTILLAVGLFTLSGAVLCYNLATLGGDEIEAAIEASVGVSPGGNYLSEAAMAALDGEPVAEDTKAALLPPIVVPG